MKLLEIQCKIVKALEGCEYFRRRDVPIVAEDLGDVSARLRAALSRARAGVLVQTPGFRVTSAASKVMVGVASVVVQAMERVLVGRVDGGATAQDMAEAAAWCLNLLPVEGVGVLAVRNISSEMLDDQTLAYAVALEVQTTLGG